jgi:hypothetical protein
VPAQWKLGDVSSFAVDAQDHIWALHRPRTLIKPEDVPKRAPAVMVFDSRRESTSRAGAATAQASSGRSASTASTSTARASSG